MPPKKKISKEKPVKSPKKLPANGSLRTCIPVFISCPASFVKPRAEHFQNIFDAGVSMETFDKLSFYYTLFLYFDVKSNSHLIALSCTDVSGIIPQPITEHYEFTEANRHLIKEFSSIPTKIFSEHEINVLKFDGKEKTFKDIDELVKIWQKHHATNKPSN